MTAVRARRAARAALVLVPATLVAGLLAGPATAASTWRLEQPAPPEGARFKVPLGAPGDLDFYAPNRGLLSVEGNAAVARGLYFYDGVSWTQLSTVCGGSGDTSRIAWAGPDEFWTVTEPSRPRSGQGTSLCRFKNGVVVGSFSTADSAPDPFRQMVSAACNGPDDCWFGGIGTQDASGTRVGAFFLRWNGTDLRTVYDPQGRGVSDLAWAGDRFVTTRYVGRRSGDRGNPDLSTAEPLGPRILRSIVGSTFRSERYVASTPPGTTPESTELLAVDHDGQDTWAVGGGAASGPGAPESGPALRPPVAVRRDGARWDEIDVKGIFAADEAFIDVAAMPGSSDAIVASAPASQRRLSTAKANVVRVRPDGTTETTRLPASGSGRGAAARIACPAPEECWMVTSAGWLFHLTDGRTYPQTTDPAFAERIDARPNEAAAQFVPDAPPIDDSQLFAPPPPPDTAIAGPTDPTLGEARRTPALIARARSRIVRTKRGLVLVVSFDLRRSAKIGLVAERGGRAVGRVKLRSLRPGRRALRLRVTRRRYPTRLRFTRPPTRAPATVPGPDATSPGTDTGGPTVVS